MRHGSHAHLNRDLFADRRRYGKCLKQLREEVARSHETFIKHYRETYTDPALPPIWAVCEVLTLGQLSQWFDNLKRRSDRKAIAQASESTKWCCAHSRIIWRRCGISVRITAGCGTEISPSA